MKAVRIVESQKEIWNKFIAENNSESFLQSWEWGEFQCSLGRKVWKLAIVEDSLFSNEDIKNYKSQITNKFQPPNKSQTFKQNYKQSG